ncbi:MAG: alpha/beta hydrolase [Alphaproteobacteria bacterium]|nr:alpha/beta hydrolase [Alphaproteobacteria bacterium]
MQKYTFNSHFATDFEYIEPKNNLPTVLYLHGFCSNAWGQKPETVKQECIKLGLGFVRFDFAGHGSDSDNFTNADFNTWINQASEVIEKVIKGNVIMIGSSMGGWISMLISIKYPDRVSGLIGLAAAPNFVKYFESNISEQQKQDLLTKGHFNIVNNDFSYTITKRFVETALASCLPENENWPIYCPVCLIQGMKDASLKWQLVLQYAEQIISEKVEVKILKNSNHRLNDETALRELRQSIANIVNI